MVYTRSILYVEDEPALLDIGKLFLEMTKEFEVITALSASVALNLLKSNKIQAIVSDYQMPGMNGIEFLKKVRATETLIPFSIFTGKGNVEIEAEAVENGADFYLKKGGATTPQYAELVHKIHASVNRQKADALNVIYKQPSYVISTTSKTIHQIHAKKELFSDICRIVPEGKSEDIPFPRTALDNDLRINADEELRASELRYRRLFETAQDAILILDGDSGEIIDANKFILDLLGYPLEYFVGKHLWELGFFKDKTLAKNAFTELKTVGYIRYEDLPLERRDGSSIEVEFVSNVYLAGGRRIVQCNIRDITDRKMAQALLKSSESCYRRLFETAQDGILIIDEKTGKIVDANPYILDLLGYPLEHFVGKHLWELGFFKDKDLAKNAFTELKTVGYIRYDDLPLETMDGRSIDVEFISNVYPVNCRNIIQCNIRDITARKRAEDALALAKKKLSLLSGITRHDIINQLTVLMGYLKMSQEMVPEGEVKEFIGKETASAKAIQRLISFTKDYEDMGVNAPVWQNVSSCIQKITGSLQMGEVKVAIDMTDVDVFADPLLERVFYNLLDNALRYGGDKISTIQVTSQEENGSLILTVADDGIGISTGDKKRLFTKGFGKNTGLGLFLSREILSITRITITENGEPGIGARFEITVPKSGYRFTPDKSKK